MWVKIHLPYLPLFASLHHHLYHHNALSFVTIVDHRQRVSKRQCIKLPKKVNAAIVKNDNNARVMIALLRTVSLHYPHMATYSNCHHTFGMKDNANLLNHYSLYQILTFERKNNASNLLNHYSVVKK